MEELKPTTIEQEMAVDTITENMPKPKKKITALCIVLIVLGVAVIATSVLVAINVVPGILMKISVLASARDRNGGTDYLYMLAEEYPYSNNTFTLNNGFEISNEYISLIIPNEFALSNELEHTSLYRLSTEDGSSSYSIIFDKTLMSFYLGEPSDSEISAEEMDALLVKHTGKRYPRNIKEINELIYSFTPDDFNIWDTEQCIVLSTIMTMKRIMIENVTEVYYYEKDGIYAQVEVMDSSWETTKKFSYIISIYDMQTETSCRCLIFDHTNQNRETIFKIINSIKLNRG